MEATEVEWPATLDYVGEQERVTESFGWAVGGFGLVALAAAVTVLMIPEFGSLRSSGKGWAVEAGLCLAGVLLLYWEVRRRLQPTVLVPRGPRVGVYRNLRLDSVVERERIGFFVLNHGNTLISVLLLVLGFALVGGMMSRTGPRAKTHAHSAAVTESERENGVRQRWMQRGIGSLILIGCLSRIYTRLLRLDVSVPLKEQLRSAELRLTRAEVYRVTGKHRELRIGRFTLLR